MVLKLSVFVKYNNLEMFREILEAINSSNTNPKVGQLLIGKNWIQSWWSTVRLSVKLSDILL